MYDHNSLSPDVLYYIDSVTPSGDQLHIKGWIAHKTSKIKQVIIGGEPIFTLLISRPDVKGVYPFLPSQTVGVDFKINKGDIKKTLGIITESGVLDNIGTLEKWYIRYSGFQNSNAGLFVVDNFYKDPDAVRDFAINNLEFKPSGYHRGSRSGRFILDGTKEKFERILGRKVTNWFHNGYANGAFQFCTADDPVVYHVDSQTFAGIVFLSKDAPLRTGTCTYKSLTTGAVRFERNEVGGETFVNTFKGSGSEVNFYDNSTLEVVDSIGNVYNRLVLWDARRIHAAEKYFGDSLDNSRFFHLFFFDVE